ncbi:ESX secretion-associated protein EspG [Saccharothrix australiensis]|uniref:ESAT-6 protein secretion system EspG family protein n=1 Tax=Saccharothrix australiensis TaxID=2072 RepID=A0A495W9B4_9PSEU|nr:ESX secretion-associated protein EspG [Saccharothrix australiensis]RKT57335.1 ESAT-6 protein secretion system EspG family protein [Saccharothrix australiensis]
MATEIVCSFAELDVLGEALRVDVRRFPFRIDHHGTTRDERAGAMAAAHRDLRARGLVRDGRFAPELVEALRLFGTGRTAVALVGTAGDDRAVALAVADERGAVLAVQRGEAVEFRPCHPSTVVRALVDLLPPLRPGPGSSVTVSDASAPIRPVDEDFSEFRFTTRLRAAAPSTRAVVEEILRRPRLGAGYFAVRSGGVDLGTLTYLDTDAGRYAVIPAADRNGVLSATYTPADQGALGRHLTRLLGPPG